MQAKMILTITIPLTAITIMDATIILVSLACWIGGWLLFWDVKQSLCILVSSVGLNFLFLYVLSWRGRFGNTNEVINIDSTINFPECRKTGNEEPRRRRTMPLWKRRVSWTLSDVWSNLVRTLSDISEIVLTMTNEVQGVLCKNYSLFNELNITFPRRFKLNKMTKI